jgi:hypothetical protein
MLTLLQNSHNGITLAMDELSLLLGMIDSKNEHSIGTSLLIEGWNAAEPYYVDRAVSESLYIEKPCISILGGIRNNVLEHHVNKYKQIGNTDGFYPRFQLVVFDTRQEMKFIDKAPNKLAQDSMSKIVELLDAWSPETDQNCGAYRSNKSAISENGAKSIYLSPEASVLFTEWFNLNCKRIYSDEVKTDIMKQHLMKYPSLVGKLAGIFHCVSSIMQTGHISPKISLTDISRAIAMAEYFEMHAQIMYNVHENSELMENQMAVNLLEKMAKHPESLTGVTDFMDCQEKLVWIDDTSVGS